MTNASRPAPVVQWRLRSWSISVYLLALMVMTGVAITTLGGARYHAITLGDSSRFDHGWPWQFGTRFLDTDVRNRFQFWQKLHDVKRWSLIGDCAVLLVASALTAWLSWRVVHARGASFSLGRAAMIVMLLCCGCAYVAAHQRAVQAEELLIGRLSNQNFVELSHEYIGPRWLLQLVGDPRPLAGTFDRVTSASIFVLGDPKSLDETAHLLCQLPYLRSISFDGDDEQLSRFLHASDDWPVNQLSLFAQENMTSEALREIGRCPNLLEVNLDFTKVDDQSVEYLSHCPHLESIYADHTCITVASIDAFARMKNLHTLSLVGMQKYIQPSDYTAFRSLTIAELRLDDDH